MLQTEDHPIKTIMDLSCLLRRAMEQEMEEFKLSSIQSRILGFLWYKREIIMKRHFRKSWNPNSRFAGLP